MTMLVLLHRQGGGLSETAVCQSLRFNENVVSFLSFGGIFGQGRSSHLGGSGTKLPERFFYATEIYTPPPMNVCSV